MLKRQKKIIYACVVPVKTVKCSRGLCHRVMQAKFVNIVSLLPKIYD